MRMCRADWIRVMANSQPLLLMERRILDNGLVPNRMIKAKGKSSLFGWSDRRIQFRPGSRLRRSNGNHRYWRNIQLSKLQVWELSTGCRKVPSKVGWTNGGSDGLWCQTSRSSIFEAKPQSSKNIRKRIRVICIRFHRCSFETKWKMLYSQNSLFTKDLSRYCLFLQPEITQIWVGNDHATEKLIQNT